jgi:MFS family permease
MSITSVELDEAIEKCKIGRFHNILFVICGLNFMMDAIEINLQPFLVNCVGFEWKLSAGEMASIGSAVYGGCFIGCFVWGVIGDKFGRRFTYLAAAGLIALAGFASAATTSVTSLVLIRSVVGFGIGGAHVPFDLLAELTPRTEHATFLTSVEYFFTLGAVFVSFLAWLFLQAFGWRTLVALTAVPISVAAIVSLFILPESPRWLLIKGRQKEAIQVLKTFLNSTIQVPQTEERDHLVSIDSTQCNDRQNTSTFSCPTKDHRVISESSSIVCDVPEKHAPVHSIPLDSDESLFGYFNLLYANRSLLRLTIPLWTTWLCFGITYYGVILYIANIYSVHQSLKFETSTCSFDYSSILLSCLSEFLGITLAIMGAARWNQMRAQIYFYVLAGIFALLLGLIHSILPTKENIGLLLVSFFARISVMAACTLTWAVTPALIPTQFRSFGHALCVAFSKVGGIVSPFLIYLSLSVSPEVSYIIIGIVIAALNFIAAISLYYISNQNLTSDSLNIDKKESVPHKTGDSIDMLHESKLSSNFTRSQRRNGHEYEMVQSPISSDLYA